MAPLSREVRPICSLSPPHLGPAVPEVNSLWFKLHLYHITGYGPPSLLLTKGTCTTWMVNFFMAYFLFVRYRFDAITARLSWFYKIAGYCLASRTCSYTCVQYIICKCGSSVFFCPHTSLWRIKSG